MRSELTDTAFPLSVFSVDWFLCSWELQPLAQCRGQETARCSTTMGSWLFFW